jgi:hypothetical protein
VGGNSLVEAWILDIAVLNHINVHGLTVDLMIIFYVSLLLHTKYS